LRASSQRIKEDVEAIARFTARGPGVNRLSFSPEHLEAIRYVEQQLRPLGFEMQMTPHGNVRFRRQQDGWDRPAVMVGSHLDAVPNGGRFDGVAGVVAAVEVARLLHESREALARPYEVVVFAEEEGARFGGVLTGSQAMVGRLSRDRARELRDAQGTSYLEALGALGVDTAAWEEAVIRPGDVCAYLELHVEQSLVLEQEHVPVGIVTAIAGIRKYQVTYRGVANHAGATPMDLRHDSLVGAAEAILAVSEVAASSPEGPAVATVGWISNSPNVSNVIPGETRFSLDVRDTDPVRLARASEALLARIRDIGARRGLEVAVEQTAATEPVRMSTRVREGLRQAAREAGIPFLEMPSGAGHDAQEMARVTDAGMIFVPSEGGRSHCPEEFTRYEDIALGSEILYRAVLKLGKHK